MKKQGFTLLELLVAIVITGIVIAVALPSYLEYTRRAKINEAFDQMSAYRLRMEQFYQDNGNYGVNNCGIANPNSEHFNFNCQLTNGGQSFTLTATGDAAEDMGGFVFSIDAAGARTTTSFPNATVPANCWLTKRGDTC